MRITGHQFAMATWILLVAGGAVRAEASGGAETGTVALQRVLSWQSVDRVDRAVHLTWIDSTTAVHRLFYLPGAPRHRLVFTSRLQPASGTLVHSVRDDETGWWVELAEHFGIDAETVDGLFVKGRSKLDETSELEWTIRTSEGMMLAVDTTVGEAQDPVRLLLDALTSRGLAASLRASVPEGLMGSILFLDTSLGNVDGSSTVGLVSGDWSDPLVELLAVLGRTADQGATPPPAPMFLDELEKRIDPASPSAAAVLEHFQHVDLADPLAPRPR